MSITITENIREKISALLDGELSQQDVNLTLDQLSEQQSLQDIWCRYNHISDVMRGDVGGRAASDFADKIRAQVDAEPAILAAPKPVSSAAAWVKPLAGTAIAASVAALAVMTAPQLLTPETAVSPQVVTTKMATPSYAQLPAIPATRNYHLVSGSPYRVRPVMTARPSAKWTTQYSGARWKNLVQPATANKLNKYLVDHSEYATQAPMRGVVPYATFVGYDARQ